MKPGIGFELAELSRSRIGLGIGLLLLWTSVGTAGFVLIEGWPVPDAFYMTIITLSTVGFQEVHPLSSHGRLFATLIIILGLTTAFYTLGSLGQVILEGELGRALGRRRMKSELDKLTDHHIVCGFGRVGKTVVEGLQHENLPFCVVERDPALEMELLRRRIPHRIGDAAEEEHLSSAGVDRARTLFTLLPSDADNLYVTLTAKGLRRDILVVARCSDERAEVKLKRGGADHVVSPYRMAGQRLLQAALHPSMLEFIELVTNRQHLELSLGEIRVCEGSILEDRSVVKAEIRARYGVIPVAIKRKDGEMVFGPDTEETMAAGDTLVALAKEVDLKKLVEACATVLPRAD